MAVIVYNGQTLPKQINKMTLRQTYDRLNFSCDFLVCSASASALVSDCATIEAALREKNKNFTMTLGGTLEYSFSHSSSGYLARPTLTRPPSDLNTETARMYSFSIEVQLPFNQVGYNHRQEGSFTVAYESSRKRTVTFKCKYTATGGGTAQNEFETHAKTWATGILTTLGGTYELITENFTTEHEEKILNGSLIYKEIFEDEIEGETNNAPVVNANCDYSVQFSQEVGRGMFSTENDPYPTVTVSIRYSADIDKTALGVAGVTIEQHYRDTIKPWLIKQASTVLGLANYSQAGIQYIVQNENYQINPYNYKISGTLTFSAPRGLDAILEYSETVTESKDENITTQKVWDGVDNTYNMYSIGSQKRMQRSVTITKLGSPVDSITQVPNPAQGKWILLDSSNKIEKRIRGAGTSGAFLNSRDVYIQSFQESYIFVTPLTIQMITLAGTSL